MEVDAHGLDSAPVATAMFFFEEEVINSRSLRSETIAFTPRQLATSFFWFSLSEWKSFGEVFSEGLFPLHGNASFISLSHKMCRYS